MTTIQTYFTGELSDPRYVVRCWSCGEHTTVPRPDRDATATTMRADHAMCIPAPCGCHRSRLLGIPVRCDRHHNQLDAASSWAGRNSRTLTLTSPGRTTT